MSMHLDGSEETLRLLRQIAESSERVAELQVRLASVAASEERRRSRLTWEAVPTSTTSKPKLGRPPKRDLYPELFWAWLEPLRPALLAPAGSDVAALSGRLCLEAGLDVNAAHVPSRRRSRKALRRVRHALLWLNRCREVHGIALQAEAEARATQESERAALDELNQRRRELERHKHVLGAWWDPVPPIDIFSAAAQWGGLAHSEWYVPSAALLEDSFLALIVSLLRMAGARKALAVAAVEALPAPWLTSRRAPRNRDGRCLEDGTAGKHEAIDRRLQRLKGTAAEMFVRRLTTTPKDFWQWSCAVNGWDPEETFGA